MAELNLGGKLTDLTQRIVLLERRLNTIFRRGGTPYGVALVFMGPDSAIPARHVRPMGQVVSRSTYAKLFAVFGTMYGVGNGTTTFQLPDMRERAAVGWMSGSAEFGSVGAKFGTKSHTLTSAEIPNLTAASNGAHTHPRPTGQLILGGNDASTLGRGPVGGSGFQGFRATDLADLVYPNPVTGSSGAHTHVVNTGGGAHNNISPSIACNWLLRY